MAFWDFFAQSLLQLREALWRCFGSKPLEGSFSTLVNDQFAILWSCAIDLRCNLSQSSAQMFHKPFGGHRYVEALTIFGHFGFALFPGEKLAAVIHKLFRASHTQIAYLEFDSKIREDTGFQVLSNKPALPFASDLDRAQPLLAGEGKINRGFQVLFRIVFMCNDEVH